jgi:cobalt-zinc-cadmium efflux system protein
MAAASRDPYDQAHSVGGDGSGHAGHSHGFGGGSGLRSLVLALALNAVYTVVEAAVGFATGSLTLLADAGHNLSDVAALAIAAGAVLLARRPATPDRSFGFKRAEILAALLNAVSLVAIATLIFVEAARRFAHPVALPGGWLIVVATAGLLINGASAAAVFRRGGRDLNLRASFIHLAGDALGSLGVIIAGVIIIATGWQYADPLFSVLLGVLILASSWGVLRDSVLVLLEAAPKGMSVESVGKAIAAYPGVVEVHDLHVWTITSDFPALSAHVLVRSGNDCHAARRGIEQMLRERYSIIHTTLQVDHAHDTQLIELGKPTQ